MLTFKPDAKLRKKLYAPESLAHPAKAHLGMMMEIIERYSQVGDIILDPMAGIGGTMMAALMGRNVICVELEQHFIDPMKASWEKMQQHPMLGCELGQVVILRGDARCLPLGRADCVVTSPPWETTGTDSGVKGKGSISQVVRKAAGAFQNYTRPAAIITSPPYEGVADAQKNTNTNDGLRGHPETQGKPMAYTRPAAIITSPPYEEGLGHGSPTPDPVDVAKSLYSGQGRYSYTRPQVDAVISSPPYEETLGAKAGGGHEKSRYQLYASGGKDSSDAAYGVTGSNIGNLRGAAYWGENGMTAVYRECHRCLRPGGLLVLILKGFTRDGKYVDLPGQTRDLCESLGFGFVEEWHRRLWSLSFWRILQRRRSPETFDDRLNYETVLVLRRQPVIPRLTRCVTCPMVKPCRKGQCRWLIHEQPAMAGMEA